MSDIVLQWWTGIYIVSDSGGIVTCCKPQFFIMFTGKASGVHFHDHV